MNEILRAQNLSFTYPNSRQALQDVSFSLEQGRFCALLGPNGAGKSTFFLLASGLAGLQGGDLSVCSHAMGRHPRKALAKMGFVFQQSTLDLDLTVHQNLSYFASLHGMSSKAAKQRIAQELERLDLGERAHERVRQLNGGHRRRVEIARALLHKPDLLLLDEASVGLDVQTRKNLVEYVHRLCRDDGVGVLWATHLIDEIEPDDRVVILHQGSVIASDQAANLGQPDLETAFRNLTSKGKE